MGCRPWEGFTEEEVAKMRVEGKKSGKVLGGQGETGWTDVGGPETVGRGGGPEEVNKEMVQIIFQLKISFTGIFLTVCHQVT